MQYLFSVLVSLISVGMMFLIAKFVGYRQISELSMWDYINSITLGSIAADLAISENLKTAVSCLIGMVIYFLFTLFFSFISLKSQKARSFIIGHPIVLMENGIMYRKNFKKAKLDIDEFLSMCRSSGYFDPFKLDTVLLEPSGKISIIPKSAHRPLTPDDMKLPVNRDTLSSNIIIDGKICYYNLRQIGFDEMWLKKQLENLGAKSEKEIFLATLDSNKELHIFKNNGNIISATL